jgi:hypothetical protein
MKDKKIKFGITDKNYLYAESRNDCVQQSPNGSWNLFRRGFFVKGFVNITEALRFLGVEVECARQAWGQNK